MIDSMSPSSPSPPASKYSTRTVVASSPGKILLAGGYLVLERPNTGLVVAVDKRFYTRVRLSMAEPTRNNVSITVSSPQFEQTWRYDFDRTTLSLAPSLDSPRDVPSEQAGNTFVEKTLRVLLLYLDVPDEVRDIHITICADREFYGGVPSNSDTNITSNSLQPIMKRQWLPVTRVDGRVVKTGLGSSACLVTSLVAALCFALNGDASDGQAASVVSPSDMPRQQPNISALSQIAHCFAQGKIGSGFDVSAACIGSHIYRRFPEAAIQHVLQQLTAMENESIHDNDQLSVETVQACLRECIQHEWPSACVVEPIHFASDSLLQVILADVSGGSESPGMARKVLQWKNSQDNPVLWTELSQTNAKIAKLFQALLNCRPTEDERSELATSTAHNWRDMAHNPLSCISIAYELNQAILQSRRHMKAMGELAGVPIEPDEQTVLADATMEIPGVVAALCPGAGGFDALACVYIHDKDDFVRRRIETFWAQWSQSSICHLDVRGISYGDGMRLEGSCIENVMS